MTTKELIVVISIGIIVMTIVIVGVLNIEAKKTRLEIEAITSRVVEKKLSEFKAETGLCADFATE